MLAELTWEFDADQSTPPTGDVAQAGRFTMLAWVKSLFNTHATFTHPWLVKQSCDGAGNVSTASTTMPAGTDNQAFCYDEQDRLTWSGATGTPPCTGTAITAGTLSAAQYTQAFTYDTMGRLATGPLGSYAYGSSGHVHAATGIGTTWTAAYDVAGNMNPVGRTYYSFSTLLCVPNALSQSGGYALGAQAGEAAIRQVITDAGFTSFRRAAETPFNLVYEVRP